MELNFAKKVFFTRHPGLVNMPEGKNFFKK